MTALAEVACHRPADGRRQQAGAPAGQRVPGQVRHGGTYVPRYRAARSGPCARGRASTAHGPEGTVTVVVSHRFSTVALADLIVVLDDGRVAEVGSHAELMAAGRGYATYYGLQTAAYR